MIPVGHCGRKKIDRLKESQRGTLEFSCFFFLICCCHQTAVCYENANEEAANLRAVVEKEAGRGPLGFTEGRGGMVELELLLLGADLE